MMSNLEQDLAHFSGGDQFYRHWSQRIVYTSGVQMLAEKAGAHWLIDLIASHQPTVKDEEFQLWVLRVDLEHKTAVVTCQADSNAPILVEQSIEYTDFPLAEMKLYCCGDISERTLLLPSEY